MSDDKKPCCSSAHNLEIVRNEYDSLNAKYRALVGECEELRRFQRLVWALLEARDLKDKQR